MGPQPAERISIADEAKAMRQTHARREQTRPMGTQRTAAPQANRLPVAWPTQATE